MKPLACDTGSGIRNNNCSIPIKNNFHLIGILNADESKEKKGWLVIAASTPAQLSPSRKRLHILKSFCPKKIPTDCVDCNNWKESPLIKIENEKEKFSTSEKPEILLIPVDQTSGDIMIENCIHLDRAILTSGSTSHVTGVSISQEQWKTLADMVTDFQEQLLPTGVAIKDTANGGKSKLDSSNSKSKSATFLKWIKTKSNGKLESSDEKDAKCGSKVKRILNFADSRGITKRNKAVKNAGATAETGSEIELKKNEHQQLIRIELKPDPGMQDSSFQFCSGDLLKLKVTMYFQHHFGATLDHHLEIDLVQNFQCKTVTQKNACRSRRITKLVKRTTVRGMRWEKGIHISGQQFALASIPYKIPAENERRSANEEEADGGCLSLGKLDDKFKVTDFRFELQIRLYEKVTDSRCEAEESSHLLAACSCFPLNLMTTTDFDKENNELSQFLTSGDILHVFPDDLSTSLEKGEGQLETGTCCEMMKKSLSATEFDV